MDGDQRADAVNLLGDFCGKRDISKLTQSELLKTYQIRQADIMILFGGSIICGGDVLAEAMQNNLAKKYMIAGGAGHTTETLRQRMQQVLPDLDTANLTEAELFSRYINVKYGLESDFLESNSTNCGNNVTYCLDLLKQYNYTFSSIIIVQDAAMQQRMDAVFRKYLPDNIKIINYAAYQAEVIWKNNQFIYKNDIWGMWDMERYISLLMGEIPRLSDNDEGYGPKGKGYIAHVDIPDKVMQAFLHLKSEYGSLIRIADPEYGS